jgi:hypothetical protein
MDTSVRSATRETCLIKYGVDNPRKSTAVAAKVKKTMLDRYGVEHAVHSPELLEKIRATNYERYGNSCVFHNTEITNKSKQTILNKYGVDNVMHDSSIREQIRNTNISRYDGPSPASSPAVLSKMQATLYNTHTVMNPGQISLQPGTLDKLQSATWLTNENSTKSISSIADELSVTVRTVSQYFTKHGLIYKKHSNSLFEQSVKHYITGITDCDIVLNTKTVISPGELDIYLPDLKIAVECNGSYWHSELNGKDKNYHLTKTKACTDAGIELIHIWEHEWKKKQELIKSRISSRLGLNLRIYARKCELSVVSKFNTAEFLNNNHIQGNCPSAINLGLYNDNVLTAIMTFGKSRFNKNVDYELLRYCSLQFTNVVGGASRLFKNFVKRCNPLSVISYSDKMRNTGNMYELIGFNFSHVSPPSYLYTKDYIKFENRVKYQKHKLVDVSSTYDPLLTEWQNMQANGFDRVWDCGTNAYIWNKSKTT